MCYFTPVIEPVLSVNHVLTSLLFQNKAFDVKALYPDKFAVTLFRACHNRAVVSELEVKNKMAFHTCTFFFSESAIVSL